MPSPGRFSTMLMHLIDRHGDELTIGDIVFYEDHMAKIEALSAPSAKNPDGVVTVCLSGERQPIAILPSEFGAKFTHL
jgi:hypothetical protein